MLFLHDGDFKLSKEVVVAVVVCFDEHGFETIEMRNHLLSIKEKKNDQREKKNMSNYLEKSKSIDVKSSSRQRISSSTVKSPIEYLPPLTKLFQITLI